jgi:hypothetical protein
MESLEQYEDEFIDIYRKACNDAYLHLFHNAYASPAFLSLSSRMRFDEPTLKFICDTKGVWQWIVFDPSHPGLIDFGEQGGVETYDTIASVMSEEIFVKPGLGYEELCAIVNKKSDIRLSNVYRKEQIKATLRDILFRAYHETQGIAGKPHFDVERECVIISEPAKGASGNTVFENGAKSTVNSQTLEALLSEKKEYALIINIPFRTIHVFGHERAGFGKGDLAFELLCLLARHPQGQAIAYKDIYSMVWPSDSHNIPETDMISRIQQVIYNKIRKFGKRNKNLSQIVVAHRGIGIMIAKGSKVLMIE